MLKAFKAEFDVKFLFEKQIYSNLVPINFYFYYFFENFHE